MRFIDFHCDTLMKLFDLYKLGDESQTVWENKCQIDVKRLSEAGYGAQFFACYLWWEDQPFLGSHYKDALKMTELFYKGLKGHEEAAFAGSWEEYLANRKEGKVSCFLTVEEGGILENQPERLTELYKAGIRLITLTWNYENCLGYPGCFPEFQAKGLKKFGIETLERMDELGIIADVSHLSDAGFEDVWKYGRRPFIASHSNARSVCPHNRNLTDEMIRKLAEKGGIAGINFGGDFLSADGKSTVEAIIANIRHMMKVGGREIVGIGTDFDGVEDELEISACQHMPELPRAMEKAGFTTGEIEDVCYKNAEKFLKRYWEG